MDSNQTRSMEAVHNFTNELFSLYDFKVPISKAKMGAITKSALKAIKFYKHVVQNVEKFILKCKPEYKIPGLYVIDAIVRQSRHQFGAEKDVFAPRFARNMEDTFAHLFRCSQEDKSKIIRVLNLWQKNNVFAPEVIQPLFDLANPDHPVHQTFNLQQQQNPTQNEISNGTAVRESPIKEDQNAEMLNASNLQKFQFQQLMMQQQADTSSGVTLESMKFNKQLLEFDYGSEGDEDKTDAMQYQAASSNALPYQFSKVLEDPNIIRQLQNIKNIDVQRYLNEMPSGASTMEMNTAPMLGSGISLANINTLRGPQTINLIESKDQDVEFIGDTMMPEVIPVSSRSPTPKHSGSKRRRSRSYSRDRYRRRRSRSRSHSRSRSRSPRNRRRSSRDRDRPRDKEREKQREIEKERRRKGLPDIKKDHLSVCSTTLWVGHLSKLVQQEELSDTFGKYGDIISIDMIPPRGCAYIVMNRRQDAHKAMQQLKNQKMHNRTITISWAAGKGVKGKEWKDYFDQTLGVTYIPYMKLSQQTDFESLEEGGMYDEDTMPAWIKEKIKQQAQPANKEGLMMPSFFGLPSDVSAIDTSQPPPSAQTLMPAAMPTFPLGARLLMPNVLPLGVPPPNMLGMVFPTTSADKSAGVIPPSLMGFPLTAAAASMHQQNVHGDDHMDIEMEDEHHNTPSTSKDALAANALLQQQAAFFNQPPPQLGMASLLMQQNDSQNERSRNNRSQSREKDRSDFRRRRTDNNSSSYNNRSSGRWPNNNTDSNSRDNRGGRNDNNGRSRDGGGYNNFNRRHHHDDQFSQPMSSMDNNRQRNNDFNTNRDDYDRRQGGFSNRGGFNQQMRGNKANFSSRGGANFSGRGGRDGNMRSYNNNFTERQGGFHDSRGSRGGRNWNRDEGDDRRSNFRSGNRTQRWSDNQRQDDGWNDEENPQSNQNDSNNEFSEENQNNFENNESRGNDDCEQTQSEDVPPGTDDYSEQQQQHDNFSNNPPSESFNPVGDNEDNSNVNDNAVVENAGNTTPLCDENEAKE